MSDETMSENNPKEIPTKVFDSLGALKTMFYDVDTYGYCFEENVLSWRFLPYGWKRDRPYKLRAMLSDKEPENPGIFNFECYIMVSEGTMVFEKKIFAASLGPVVIRSESEKPIGETIKRLRLSLGYTQLQLAELIGVSDKAISKWECGDGMPDISQIVPLAKAFGVSTDELLGLTLKQ